MEEKITTPEGRVKDKVKKILKLAGAYYHCPVQNGMGAPTLDIIGCYLGTYFAIECKAPGKHPTPRQQNTAEEIRKAGGVVFIIDGDTRDLELWLNGEIAEPQQAQLNLGAKV